MEHFPAPRRSAIANRFHFSVRDGQSTPAAAVHQVQQEVQRRLQWANTPTDEAHLRAVLEALQTDRAGALAYAKSVIAYEQLPYEDRQRMKAERATPYLQESMRGKPVTDKQTALLRTLGYTGPQPEDRAAARALIERFKRGGARL